MEGEKAMKKKIQDKAIPQIKKYLPARFLIRRSLAGRIALSAAFLRFWLGFVLSLYLPSLFQPMSSFRKPWEVKNILYHLGGLNNDMSKRLLNLWTFDFLRKGGGIIMKKLITSFLLTGFLLAGLCTLPGNIRAQESQPYPSYTPQTTQAQPATPANPAMPATQADPATPAQPATPAMPKTRMTKPMQKGMQEEEKHESKQAEKHEMEMRKMHMPKKMKMRKMRMQMKKMEKRMDKMEMQMRKMEMKKQRPMQKPEPMPMMKKQGQMNNQPMQMNQGMHTGTMVNPGRKR